MGPLSGGGIFEVVPPSTVANPPIMFPAPTLFNPTGETTNNDTTLGTFPCMASCFIKIKFCSFRRINSNSAEAFCSAFNFFFNSLFAHYSDSAFGTMASGCSAFPATLWKVSPSTSSAEFSSCCIANSPVIGGTVGDCDESTDGAIVAMGRVGTEIPWSTP